MEKLTSSFTESYFYLAWLNRKKKMTSFYTESYMTSSCDIKMAILSRSRSRAVTAVLTGYDVLKSNDTFLSYSLQNSLKLYLFWFSPERQNAMTLLLYTCLVTTGG